MTHETTGTVAHPGYYAPLDADRRMEHFQQAVKVGDPVNIAIADKGQVAADRVSVLVEAQGLVHGDRNRSYGSPLSDYSRTAGMVSAMLAHKLKDPLTAEDCAMIMCCVKLSRQAHKPKRDSMVDLAGYAECVQWILDERSRIEAASARPSAL